VARDVIVNVSPEQTAGFLARAAARALETDDLVTFLAAAAKRAREERWLEPLMQQWLQRLEAWATSEESHAVIHAHLERAGAAYRGQGWFKSFTYQVAEVFGGVDLHTAATILQNEIARFAREQGADEGHVRRVLSEGLDQIEHKLRDDPTFVRGLHAFLVEISDSGTLPVLFRPVLASVQAEGLRELDRPDSPLLRWAVRQLEGWLERLESNEATRAEVNGWCRQTAELVLDRHHAVIGLLVEEQLARLSDERLVTLIEDRVGEDLNWIRLNGTVLGGLIGVVLYLLFWGLGKLVGP
jgi:uncharacterized membrane-anchored protein YjiN (DUF445 family)